MSKDKSLNDFENEYIESVRWLRDHVAPDDVYEFAQQTLMAAQCFLKKLCCRGDLQYELDSDRELSIWTNNIVNFMEAKRLNKPGMLDCSYTIEKI